MASLKRVQDIELALRWAFGEELPKRRADGRRTMTDFPSVCPMFRMAANGGVGSSFAREPGFPLALGEPHPDALLIEQAVADLAEGHDLDIADFAMQWGTNPVDLDVEILALRAVEQIQGLVVTRARRSCRPEWGQDIELEPVRDPANGRPNLFIREPETREINGTSYTVDVEKHARGRAGEYKTGTYSKIRFTPGRVHVYEERAEYAAWHAALVLLVERLAGTLASIEVTAPRAARRPWLGDKDAGPTVRTDLKTPPSYGPLRAAPPISRRTAGPRAAAPKASEVRHLPIRA